MSKHWRPLTEHEFWHELDAPMTNAAIVCAQFPQEVQEWVFEPKRQAFEVTLRH